MIDYREISDLNAPELQIYSGVKEVQLKRFYEPQPGLFICESPKVISRALNAGYEPVSILLEPKYIEKDDSGVLSQIENISSKKEKEAGAEENKIPGYLMTAETMSRLTGYHLTGGMLCAMRRKKLPTAEELCRNAARIAVLDNIENPTNIGAIFRSAAAMKMDAVLLTADCSDPLYRRAARVSVGCVFQIPWTILPPEDKEGAGANPGGYPALLHQLGFRLAALALSDDSISISDPPLKKAGKLAILLGNEGDGLKPETLSACDCIVKIPMAEGVDSLNVAAASAVAFWELNKSRP